MSAKGWEYASWFKLSILASCKSEIPQVDLQSVSTTQHNLDQLSTLGHIHLAVGGCGGLWQWWTNHVTNISKANMLYEVVNIFSTCTKPANLEKGMRNWSQGHFPDVTVMSLMTSLCWHGSWAQAWLPKNGTGIVGMGTGGLKTRTWLVRQTKKKALGHWDTDQNPVLLQSW